MTLEEINNMKYKVCCPLCDNIECVKGTDKCEAEMWARQKRSEEVNADKGVLEKINEKQDSLRATCKAWDEAIEKDGYVD